RGGDRLAVMGSPRQVENFCRQQARYGAEQLGPLRTLRDYVAMQGAEDCADCTGQLLCYGIHLDRSMPQVGKAVRDSGIKADWSAILIGLERDLLPMPAPDPSLTLRAGDLLWVMGSREMAAKLLDLGLLDQ
ncbi:MAG: TrkA C-terminal domain-containing protein, partial [Clostridiales bacterium]|nr:TrkA C-terminal domain-containing protein [Clostridiales bacterium]